MSKQVAFIGGLSGGVGSSLARILLAEGWIVGGFSRSGEAKNSLDGISDDFDHYEVDGTNAEAVDAAFSKFQEAHGRIDAYVHAVGSVYLKPLHLTSDADWELVRKTNLDSAFYAARSAVKRMQKQKSGRIVLISSVAAQSGLSNHEAIAAAKGGVEGLVRSTSATYASSGIRVNGVALGLVETPATKMLTGNEQAKAISTKMHPIGELGSSEKVASLIQWLISEQASWVTGHVWTMDGGMGTIVPKPKL